MPKCRISQIVDADGQAWIAFIANGEIVSRHTDYPSAKAARRAWLQTQKVKS